MTHTMTSTKRRIIVIVGATGSGKTDLSITLAHHYDAPIVSADSRQVYRGMAIGTAQPTCEQLQSAEHHFIASFDITQEFNCGEFEKQALALLEELFKKHETIIVVGGSGLYIKALCEGMDDLPEADKELRDAISREYADKGLSPLVDELRERDPVYYEQVDRFNPARVLRAIEVCRATGRPYSELRKGIKQKRNFDIVKIGVERPREELYDRINRRVDAMMSEGLEAEARALLSYRDCNALHTVGYSEVFNYFDGNISRDEAVELIKRNSRRYAKRQITWFGRDDEIRWFCPAQVDKIVNYIDSLFGESDIKS